MITTLLCSDPIIALAYDIESKPQPLLPWSEFGVPFIMAGRDHSASYLRILELIDGASVPEWSRFCPSLEAYVLVEPYCMSQINMGEDMLE